MKNKPYVIVPIALICILGALILLSSLNVDIDLRNSLILMSSATIIGAFRLIIASVVQFVIQSESRRRMRKLMGVPKPYRSDHGVGQPLKEESASNK